MKNQLQCQVVMLPQQDYFDKAKIGDCINTGIMLHGSGYDACGVTDEGWIDSILDIGGIPQHLYLTSDRKIKGGDWYYRNDTKRVEQFPVGQDTTEVINDHKDIFKKIEATTDISLESLQQTGMLGMRDKPIPQIPESFVQAYVKANGDIKDVMIEMEEHSFPSEQDIIYYSNIKVRPNNTVIISQSKLYTRDEVKQLCFQAFIDHKCIDKKIKPSEAEKLIEPFNKWIEENL